MGTTHVLGTPNCTSLQRYPHQYFTIPRFLSAQGRNNLVNGGIGNRLLPHSKLSLANENHRRFVFQPKNSRFIRFTNNPCASSRGSAWFCLCHSCIIVALNCCTCGSGGAGRSSGPTCPTEQGSFKTDKF